jgi:hypothetical protein
VPSCNPPPRNPFVLPPRRTKPSDPAFLFLSLFSSVPLQCSETLSVSLLVPSGPSLLASLLVPLLYVVHSRFSTFFLQFPSTCECWTEVELGLMSLRIWFGTIPNGLPYEVYRLIGSLCPQSLCSDIHSYFTSAAGFYSVVAMSLFRYAVEILLRRDARLTFGLASIDPQCRPSHRCPHLRL